MSELIKRAFETGSAYTCNGSPKGCGREREGGCIYHEQLEQQIVQINGFSQYEMCRQWRFGKSGQYPWFDTSSPLWPMWEARFKEFGGMTTEISKSLGWE